MITRTVEEHFSGRAAHVCEIDRQIVDASTTPGLVNEDPKKTSLHLNRRAAFAGVQMRRDAPILTLTSDKVITHRRVHKTEQTSANRWHFQCG